MDKQKEVKVAFVRRYRLVEHTCPICGTKFEAPGVRVYCSNSCRQKAAWDRNGAVWSERRKAVAARKKGEVIE